MSINQMPCGENLKYVYSYGKVSVNSIDPERPCGEMWDNAHIPKEWEVDTVYIRDGVTRIGANTFNDTELSDVHLPDGLEEIGENAFAGCLNLEEVDIPIGLEKVEASAFERTGLSEITIPRGTKEIGENAFANCDNLSQADIHAKTIKEAAFHNSGIKDLTIGDEVKNIEDRAFANNYISGKVKMIGVVNIGEQSFNRADAEFITNENIAAILREEGINARIPNLAERAAVAREECVTFNENIETPEFAIRDEIVM